MTAPTSALELFAVSAEAARELAGAERSAWTGEVFETTGTILGLAHWDGSLYLDRECIVEPLERMYEHAGEAQPAPVLVSYREALSTLLHEQAHFLGPSNASQDAAREAFILPGARQLEEGVTEAWTQDHLDDFIRRLGVDKVAPGIDSVESTGYYPAFVPAVRLITADLETRADLAPGELIDLFNRETAATQLPLLATLAYNSTPLPELESAGSNTRDRFESIIRDSLASLDRYELSPPGHAAARSHLTAGLLLEALREEAHKVESSVTTHAHACELPPPAQTAFSGLAHPTAITPTTTRTAAAVVRPATARALLQVR